MLPSPIMGDPPSPRTPLEHALTKDAKLRGAILQMARKQARTHDEAKDFAQEAMLRAIQRSRETGEPPPPPEFRKFLFFVGTVFSRFGYNARRADRRHPQAELDVADTKPAIGLAHSPDRIHEDRNEERLRQRMDKELREVLAAQDEKSRRIALRMLELCDERGMHGIDDFVAAIRCSSEDIHNARKCLAHHGRRVWQRILTEEGAPA